MDRVDDRGGSRLARVGGGQVTRRGWLDWEGEGFVGPFGTAHSVSGEPPQYDVVAALHRVVEEVTGKPVTSARRMGFY